MNAASTCPGIHTLAHGSATGIAEEGALLVVAWVAHWVPSRVPLMVHKLALAWVPLMVHQLALAWVPLMVGHTYSLARCLHFDMPRYYREKTNRRNLSTNYNLRLPDCNCSPGHSHILCGRLPPLEYHPRSACHT
jgi:hypothetical protein